MTTEKMTICENHLDRETPMISTFRFPGAELWCPYCGAVAGMFDGFGREVYATEELRKRAIEDRKNNISILKGES